jgi:hypothetical protein
LPLQWQSQNATTLSPFTFLGRLKPRFRSPFFAVAVDDRRIDSDVIGHCVSPDGSRFATLGPVSKAVIARFGGTETNAGRGVTACADNGPH